MDDPIPQQGHADLPATDTPEASVRPDDIADLIRRADGHDLGRTFLLQGAQDAVAATFAVHAFVVDAARDHLMTALRPAGDQA